MASFLCLKQRLQRVEDIVCSFNLCGHMFDLCLQTNSSTRGRKSWKMGLDRIVLVRARVHTLLVYHCDSQIETYLPLHVQRQAYTKVPLFLFLLSNLFLLLILTLKQVWEGFTWDRHICVHCEPHYWTTNYIYGHQHSSLSHGLRLSAWEAERLSIRWWWVMSNILCSPRGLSVLKGMATILQEIQSWTQMPRSLF